MLSERGYKVGFFTTRRQRLETLVAMLNDRELCLEVNLIVYRVSLLQFGQSLSDTESTGNTRKYILLGGPIFEDQFSNIVRDTIKLLKGINSDFLFSLKELNLLSKTLLEVRIDTKEYGQPSEGPTTAFFRQCCS